MNFDRLVTTVDRWAGHRGRGDVVAQIGQTTYRPSNMKWTAFLSPDEFARHIEQASAIVAHAGTGSILTALERGKPIVIFPRRASLGETRSDHQVATAQKFLRFASVFPAFDE